MTRSDLAKSAAGADGPWNYTIERPIFAPTEGATRATRGGLGELVRDLYPPAVTVGITEDPTRERVIDGFWRRLWRSLVFRPLLETYEARGVAVLHVIEHGGHDEVAEAVLLAAIEEARPAGIVIEVEFSEEI